MAKLYVGIDLGTTNSTVSVIQTDERWLEDPIEKLRSMPILQYADIATPILDQETLPSYFFCMPEESKVYTGKVAKNMYITGNDPMRCFAGVKTRIGGESQVSIPDKTNDTEMLLDMTQCSALLLKVIRQSLEKQFEQEIDHLVVTVPAAFNSDERQATRDAIELAGFQNYHILDEPAATLLYFINNGDGSLTDNAIELNDKNVLVYDIGGGTLDVCIAHLEEDLSSAEYDNMKVKIISRSTRENLGGSDFDRYLGAYFLSEFENRTIKLSERPMEEQVQIISRLVGQAEHYKIVMSDRIKEYRKNPWRLNRLCISPEFEVIDGQYLQGINLTKEVIDEVFSSLTSDNSQQNILRPVKKCIASAENLRKEDISLVILTGGMSNFYRVEEVLEEYFGNIPMIKVDTTTSVSKGAAIDAYNFSKDNISLTKMELQDRLAENIFLRTDNGFDQLISQNDIATRKEGTFLYTISSDDLTRIPIFLYYGLERTALENFTPIAGKIVKLPRRYQRGEQISLNWHIDSDGVITITIDALNAEFQVNSETRRELLKKQQKLIDQLTVY